MRPLFVLETRRTRSSSLTICFSRNPRKQLAISLEIPANSPLRSDERRRIHRTRFSRQSRAWPTRYRVARRNVAHLEDRYLPMDPRRLFVPHLHTSAHAYTGARIARPPIVHRRGHNAVAHAISSHSSPFSALRASDTVTVYPSPTHTHDENTVVESRANASNGGVAGGGSGTAVDAALVCTCYSYERSSMRGRSGDLRLLPPARLLFA